MRYLLLAPLLLSCSSLVPSVPSVPTPTSSTAPTTQVGAAMKGVEDSIWSYAYLSVFLLIFFPSMREPIRAFLSALFLVMRLPLDYIAMMYNKKFNNEK